MIIKKIILFSAFFLILFSLALANDPWNKRVYLATFPRSGNHWMRFLLEEATQIATSSVYCDRNPPHIKQSFPWGGYCADHGYMGNCRYPRPGDTFVVKTHCPCFSANQFDLRPSVKTIRIVRHPVDSFYSYYVYWRRVSEEKVPREFVEKYIPLWRKFQEYWDRQDNVITIRYEDLFQETERVFSEVIAATGYELPKEDIQRAIAINPPSGAILKHLQHFRPEELELIRSELADLLEKYDYDVPDYETDY